MTVSNINDVLRAGDDDVAPEFSEEALALVFARRHAHELRYVAAWNRWFIWDGMCWRKDETKQVFSLARKLCRDTATTINKPPEAKRLASAKTRAAVVALAGEDRRLAATIDQWDTDPWLLNTPGGVVDLRSGAMQAHRPADYMTKITIVAPAGDCPKWKGFIAKVTGNDEDLAQFLQRIEGYALTGKTSEHAIFFLYGGGQNGKSQFMSATSGVVGDYHCAAPIEAFTENQGEHHPTELAKLMGARLVTATEPERGQRWKETRIKQLTGGDVISARFMRQDFFDFAPQFKLFIAGNNKPGLRGVDKAISRRMNIIPFGVTITDEEKIEDFAKIMIAEEGPGILKWMIDGCLKWQELGLARPQAVKDATDKYLSDEDHVRAWVEEECIKDAQAQTRAVDLFDKWKSWAERRNQFVGTMKDFNQKLESLGYKRPVKRSELGATFIGIKLDPQPAMP